MSAPFLTLSQARGLAVPKRKTRPLKYAKTGLSVKQLRDLCKARGQTILSSKRGMADWYRSYKRGETREPPCRAKKQRKRRSTQRKSRGGMSEWNRFVHDHYQAVAMRHPDATGGEVMQILSEHYQGGGPFLEAVADFGASVRTGGGGGSAGRSLITGEPYVPSAGALGEVGIPEDLVDALSRSDALVQALKSDPSLIDVVVKTPEIAEMIADSPEMIEAMSRDGSLIDEVISGKPSATTRDSAKAVGDLFKQLGVQVGDADASADEVSKLAKAAIADGTDVSQDELANAVSIGRSRGTPSLTIW